MLLCILCFSFEVFLLQIREETDTRIDLPGELSDSQVIIITGRKEDIERAKDMLEAKIKEQARNQNDRFLALGYVKPRELGGI